VFCLVGLFLSPPRLSNLRVYSFPPGDLNSGPPAYLVLIHDGWWSYKTGTLNQAELRAQ